MGVRCPPEQESAFDVMTKIPMTASHAKGAPTPMVRRNQGPAQIGFRSRVEGEQLRRRIQSVFATRFMPIC